MFFFKTAKIKTFDTHIPETQYFSLFELVHYFVGECQFLPTLLVTRN